MSHFSQEGISRNDNNACNSPVSKSKVSKNKVKKPSLIPLRQTNAGYLELHYQKQRTPSKVSINVSKTPPTSSSKLDPVPNDKRRIYGTSRALTFTPITPPVTLQHQAVSGRSSKRSLRSIHSSRLNVNKFLNDNLGSGKEISEKLHEDQELQNISVNPSTVAFEQARGSTSNDLAEPRSSSPSVPKLYSILPEPDPSYLWIFARKIGEVADRTRGYFLCPICNEPLNYSAVIACGHIFCMRCTCNWFETQENCPCCRFHITGKDMNDDTVIAKELPEASTVLASVFKAGDFYDSVTVANEDLSETEIESCLHSCPLSVKILSDVIAPAIKVILKENKGNAANFFQIKGQGNEEENHYYNFMGALWLVRQTHLLQISQNTGAKITGENYCSFDEPESETTIGPIPRLIRLEIDIGNEASLESLLRRIMSMNSTGTNHSSKIGLRTSASSLTSISSRRRLIGRVTTSPESHLVFHLPTLQTFFKMLAVSIIFLLLCVLVHIFDDYAKASKAIISKGFDFSKLELIIYSVVVFMMVTYTETDRMAYLRRRAANRTARMRRRNRRDPPTDEYIFM